MPNSEVLPAKTEAEPASASAARSQAELSHINAHQGADALARDWLLNQGPSDLSAGTKTKVLLGAAAQGTVLNGMDEICNHPGRAAGEVLGAVAIGVAMRGPAWIRLPAMALAAVGTVAYAQHVAEAGVSSASLLSQMNSRNLEESRQGLAAALGPVIFDTALMGLAGGASAKLATRLPAEFSQTQLASTLSLAKDHVTNFLGGGDGFGPGMGMGMRPAYAMAGGSPSFRFESVMPGPRVAAAENVMQMSMEPGASSVSGDGIKFRTSRGAQGETIYNIDHLPSGRTVNMRHEGGAVTSVSHDGKVTVGFATGEGRKLDLGQTIRRIVMTEYPGGLKQFRFNEKIAADLEVDNDGHTLRALLGNGDHVHMLDNIKDGFMHFPHNDGLQTWVEHSGRVVVQLPGGKLHEVKIGSKLAYIRLLEKADGSKEFRFLDDGGQPVAKKIQLPSTPELQQMKAPDEVQNWHDLRNYIAAKNQARQNLHNTAMAPNGQGGGDGVYRVNPSPGGVLRGNNHGNSSARGFFRMPTSIDRVMTNELLGIPNYVMRNNDLSAPADMELALQDHGWVITNYLDRLDFHEEAHHHNF